MAQERSNIKGGVIVIGSLLWENEQNCLPDDEKGIMRRTWRKNNLDLNKGFNVPLPIRYGRSSSSRMCTYTMVFSKECQEQKMGQGKVIPFKDTFDFSNYQNFEKQIDNLAKVEGIYRQKRKFSTDWGAVAIWINSKSLNREKISSFWRDIINGNGYGTDTDGYNWRDGKIITNEYMIELEIDTDLDFLLCTYIKPKHKNITNDKEQLYPTNEEIANEISTSGYSTYFDQNNVNGIITFQDNEIKELLINR